MKLFVAIYDDAQLLGHFVRHYSAIGISEFFVAISPELRVEAHELAGDHNVMFFENLDVKGSFVGTAAVTEMRRLHQDGDEWIVIADLDEFLQCDSLLKVAEAAEAAEANVVRGIMHDRFSLDGQPHDVSPDTDLDDLFPIKSRFVRDVMGGCDHKGSVVKGHLRPAPGALHHWFDDERGFSDVLEISHFKWTTSALNRVKVGRNVYRNAGIAWANEYERLLDHYEEHGRFAWEGFGGKHHHEFVPEPPEGHCSECNAAISSAEREYSRAKFGEALCRRHQALRRGPLG